MDGRHRIYPSEQHVHGFMTVLPLVAASLLAVLHRDVIRSSGWMLQPPDESARAGPEDVHPSFKSAIFRQLGAGAPVMLSGIHREIGMASWRESARRGVLTGSATALASAGALVIASSARAPATHNRRFHATRRKDD